MTTHIQRRFWLPDVNRPVVVTWAVSSTSEADRYIRQLASDERHARAIDCPALADQLHEVIDALLETRGRLPSTTTHRAQEPA